jgi:hypothetical protein
LLFTTEKKEKEKKQKAPKKNKKNLRGVVKNGSRPRPTFEERSGETVCVTLGIDILRKSISKSPGSSISMSPSHHDTQEETKKVGVERKKKGGMKGNPRGGRWTGFDR